LDFTCWQIFTSKKKGEKHQYASGWLDKTDLDPAYQIMLGSMIFLWQTFATW
jgi:hypothetical protein